MDKANPIRDKSFAFALRVIKLSKKLRAEDKEFVLSKQILGSGTSIGANIEEALQGQSRKDFIAKLSIALKEIYETRYWLRLLHGSELLTKALFNSFMQDLEELRRILIAIIKTSKGKSD